MIIYGSGTGLMVTRSTRVRPDLAHIAALLLVFFSFSMSLLVAERVFEHLPHLEDEMAYLYQARIFARGDVVIDSPQPPRAFWQPFVVDYDGTGHRFGKYSPGWPALLAVGELFGRLWIINAFCAAGTVALTYRLGREIFNADVGVIGAALTAFSPMALLLNGTLMGHTSALFNFALFMYAIWRIERGRRAAWWGLAAGVGLGLLVINRPLTAIGVVTPFILWSGLRVLLALRNANPIGINRLGERPLLAGWRGRLVTTLRPLVILAVITVLFSLAIPLFNAAAVDDPTFNLYTLVWPYDRVGFGTCCGRSSLPENGGEGHTIVKGIRHARFDLSLTAADLFGWNIGAITPDVQQHLRLESDYWPLFGLSFFILPLGLALGLRRTWLWAWLVVALIWLVYPLVQNLPFLRGFMVDSIANTPTQLQQARNLIWAWLTFGAVWMLVPPIGLMLQRLSQPTPAPEATDEAAVVWTWLLLAVIVGLIGLHLAYWIGSQRYSTRYYFEALTAFALIAALPIAWLIRRSRSVVWRGLLYTLFTALLFYTLYAYSTPRINALYRFNFISPELAQQVDARREGDRPVLVIVTGATNDVRWRSYGSLMALTGPYLDTDIVAAWDYVPGTGVREQLLALFPDRQVIDLIAEANTSWFSDEPRPPAISQR